MSVPELVTTDCFSNQKKRKKHFEGVIHAILKQMPKIGSNSLPIIIKGA